MENLGKTAQDKVTGFTGTITAYCKYLSGFETYQIQPLSEKADTLKKAQWFSVEAVKVL
jgi:hypothetical protein